MSNDDFTRALREDLQRRECDKVFAMTAQEQRDAERRAKAEAFERGDHQPDGSVKQNPNAGCGQGIFTGGGAGSDKVAGSAQLTRAMQQMDAYLVKNEKALLFQQKPMRARGNANGILATGMPCAVTDCDGTTDEMVSVQVFLRMDHQLAERLREVMNAHPDRLDNLLRGILNEVRYSLEYHYGVTSHPVG